MPIHILLADDHPVVRFGIRGMFAGQPDFTIVAEASDGAQTIELVQRLHPDIVLMDLQMPGINGLEALCAIRQFQADACILILSTFDNEQDVREALAAGAMGYILKDAPRDELYRAIRLAMHGQIVLSESISSHASPQPGTYMLSRRELEILSLVAQGHTNQEIGTRLYISETTVKTHLKHVYAKLNVPDRTAAVALAVDRKLIRSTG